jgi:hypothetical protein
VGSILGKLHCGLYTRQAPLWALFNLHSRNPVSTIDHSVSLNLNCHSHGSLLALYLTWSNHGVHLSCVAELENATFGLCSTHICTVCVQYVYSWFYGANLHTCACGCVDPYVCTYVCTCTCTCACFAHIVVCCGWHGSDVQCVVHYQLVHSTSVHCLWSTESNPHLSHT